MLIAHTKIKNKLTCTHSRHVRNALATEAFRIRDTTLESTTRSMCDCSWTFFSDRVSFSDSTSFFSDSSEAVLSTIRLSAFCSCSIIAARSSISARNLAMASSTWSASYRRLPPNEASLTSASAANEDDADGFTGWLGSSNEDDVDGFTGWLGSSAPKPKVEGSNPPFGVALGVGSVDAAGVKNPKPC